MHPTSVRASSSTHKNLTPPVCLTNLVRSGFRGCPSLYSVSYGQPPTLSAAGLGDQPFSDVPPSLVPSSPTRCCAKHSTQRLLKLASRGTPRPRILCRAASKDEGNIVSQFFSGDLPKNTAILLALLVFSRLGVYIRLPGVDVDAFAASMQGGGLLGYIDTLSGGSISRVGVFSLGKWSWPAREAGGP